MDRNAAGSWRLVMNPSSLSARRAWIEILNPGASFFRAWVALRKESVDRNQISRDVRQGNRQSLSARRAWIEIPSPKIL